MRKIIKNNYKFILGLLVGLIMSVSGVYAIDAYIESNKVTYDNHNKKNVQEAIDELYERSGIHKDKWIDPILNGADPVLKDPLIPVEIEPNGDVYYANEKSEWYNYSEKRWANAVILIDNPSNEYGVGSKIEEDDIESYFVWIPRYQYKIWDMGKYTTVNSITSLQNSFVDNETSYRRMFGNTRIIDIKFGSADKIAKMNESEAAIGEYYTHPAFTLGDKNLNGFWMGKFETGYKGAKSKEEASTNVEDKDSVIIKPNVYSWRGIVVKNIFMNSYNYERGLDSHMLKNTEWGAVAYLSHSPYGIGTGISVNNNSDYLTGYSTEMNIIQNSITGNYGVESSKTQPYNTLSGYLASTTGNITGVYDMSGGAHDYVAAYIGGLLGQSGFLDNNELVSGIYKGYFDIYSTNASYEVFDKRILGDATGEMGPFYKWVEVNGTTYPHSSWYQDTPAFIATDSPWFIRGGNMDFGILAGQFDFNVSTGAGMVHMGYRVALAP